MAWPRSFRRCSMPDRLARSRLFRRRIRSTQKRRRILPVSSWMIRMISAFSRVSRRSGIQRSISSPSPSLACPADHPALQKAASWLADKEVRFRGDWTVNNPHPEASGWAFEYNNVYYPDTDDTAMVLMALRLVRPNDPAGARCTVRARARLAAEFPVPRRRLGGVRQGSDAALARRHAVRGSQRDSRSDLQRSDRAHARTCSATSVSMRTSACVRRAVQYLIDTQDDDGSWYGRWGVNYIYGTWQVLRGLRAIGEDMTQDWILRGRDWLESCQNDDGGWGETCASYENRALKGKGESTASQTSWALMGICACGDLDRPSVQRGLRFLLATQQPDGSWMNRRSPGLVSRACSISSTICIVRISRCSRWRLTSIIAADSDISRALSLLICSRVPADSANSVATDR